MTPALVGTAELVRLALRRDRVMLPAWGLAIAGTVVATAASFADLYPTAAARARFASGIAENTATVALYGRVYDSSIGGLTAWRIGTVAMTLAGLMSLLAVVRHTRAEEEAGRLELIGAGVVGRHAPLAAALAVTAAADLAIGLLICLGLVAVGLPLTGAVALGLAVAASGWVFGAAAAVSAQLVESARAANGIAAAALGAAYLLRAVGDTAGDGALGSLSWLSPLGWAQRVRPFAHERWWPLALAVALAAVLVLAAAWLVARRDLGAGLLPTRPGPAHAAPGLRTPLALAWRLQRGALLGWTAGFLVIGAALGSIAQGVTDLVEASPQLEDLLKEIGGQQGIVDAYLATAFGFLGIVAAAYGVQATLRLRVEETTGRLEPLLSTAVRRVRWALSHIAFAVAGTTLVLTAAGLTGGLAHGLRTGDVAGQLPRVLGAALVQVPAAWVLAGVAVVLFGFAPRLSAASWAALAACLLLGQLGPVLHLDRWIMDLSPFTHVPKLPGDDAAAGPLLSLAAVAAAFTAAGLAGFRRRDVG
jgi:ABC-2 type transport system permease protein